MNAAAAAFQAAKTSGAMGMMPPGMAMPMVSAAAAASAANLTVPSVSTPNAMHSDAGSRAASAARARSSTPSGGAGTPQLKRAKHEPEDDGELEIDVQNDDARSLPSASHTNGTSVAGSSKPPKDGRESAQSVSSRDSTTPRSARQVRFFLTISRLHGLLWHRQPTFFSLLRLPLRHPSCLPVLSRT